MTKKEDNSDKFYKQFLDMVDKFIPENYFQKHLSLSKKFDLFENPQFQELLKHSPAIVGVFNNVKMGYEFISDNIETITSHSPKDYLGENGMEKVIATFPVHHATIYNNYIFPGIYEHFKTHAADHEIKRFRFTASFQIIKKDNSTIWCMQQLTPIETDDQGFPILVLVFMSDISHIKKDDAVDFVIARKDDQQVYQNVYAATFPTANEITSFSKRELEVLQLLSKGKSSIEIGDLLSISEHTVNNHRKNMLGKADKKNTVELLSFAINKGFIKS